MSQHPTGKFAATVISAEVGESKTKKTPGVFFNFRTSQGEIEGNAWLSENAYERTLNLLRTCFGFDDDFSTISAQCVGQTVLITIETETDEKWKEWSRVKWINPAKTAAAPASGGLLASLTARARGIACPADAPKAAPKPAPADDEVPF